MVWIVDGSFAESYYPASAVLWPCPTPAWTIAMAMSEARPPSPRVSPNYPTHPSNMPCPLPRWTRTGASVGCFPVPRGLPRYSGGSASMTSLSRPAQASLALRPAGLLNRPKAAFVTRLRPDRLPDQAARQLPGLTDNCLGGSSLPLVNRAVGEHRIRRVESQNEGILEIFS